MKSGLHAGHCWVSWKCCAVSSLLGNRCLPCLLSPYILIEKWICRQCFKTTSGEMCDVLGKHASPFCFSSLGGGGVGATPGSVLNPGRLEGLYGVLGSNSGWLHARQVLSLLWLLFYLLFFYFIIFGPYPEMLRDHFFLFSGDHMGV